MSNKKTVQVVREGIEFDVKTTDDPLRLLLVHPLLKWRISYSGLGKWRGNYFIDRGLDDLLCEFAKGVVERIKEVEIAKEAYVREQAYNKLQAEDVAAAFESLRKDPSGALKGNNNEKEN